jgi:glycosyltransferase involved in cell wall biosynthesis
MIKSKITLLVPLYNPEKDWHLLFEARYNAFCNSVGLIVPVVLINDGSYIEISESVLYLKAQLGTSFNYIGYSENRGKGAALKYGAEFADSYKFIFTDIDFPYTTESMKQVWETMINTSGIVIGYRQQAYYADLSVFRTILSKSLRFLNKSLLGLPVNDTQCGLKAFDADVKELLLKCETDRFLIDLELLLAVSAKKYQITPILVSLREDIDFTKFNSTVLLKEVFNFFRLIWKYRIIKS